MKDRVQLVEGDITQLKVDAIMNAANKSLLGGGGVDGAIHRAAGTQLLAECRTLGGCETGDAKITTGGNLAAKYVIHTVGPVYRNGTAGEPELLASCYPRSLEVAVDNGVRSVSFPSISTGAYRYPMDTAARIAIETVIEFMRGASNIDLVRFVLYGRPAFETYRSQLSDIAEAENLCE